MGLLEKMRCCGKSFARECTVIFYTLFAATAFIINWKLSADDGVRSNYIVGQPKRGFRADSHSRLNVFFLFIFKII